MSERPARPVLAMPAPILHPLYVVAECGGTHGGALGEALALMKAAKEAGADAVKFTIRDLDAEMTPQMAARPYHGPHSYGATYGEHRAALELSQDQLTSLRQEAYDLEIDFGLTVCAPSCVERAVELRPHWLKLASRDANNVPLIGAIREAWGGPVVMSTGMDSPQDVFPRIRELRESIDVVPLYCISAYPAPAEYYDHVHLSSWLNHGVTRYGYSDHVRGWHMTVLAIAGGATWIEKHLTLDANGKGSDHQVSLEPAAFREMVDALRDAYSALRVLSPERGTEHFRARAKLGRSVAVTHDMAAGDVIVVADLHMVSPGTGLPWAAVPELVGRNLRVAKARNELLSLEDVEE